jgi:isocitrate/isopropylmalate dehydrogenase
MRCSSTTLRCSSFATRVASTSLLTENTFGDILSDVAAVATGGVGLAPSASLSGTARIFEPIHGSAPTSRGAESRTRPRCCVRRPDALVRAGPAGRGAPARRAVDEALRSTPTVDLGGTATTEEFGDAVVALLAEPGV